MSHVYRRMGYSPLTQYSHIRIKEGNDELLTSTWAVNLRKNLVPMEMVRTMSAPWARAPIVLYFEESPHHSGGLKYINIHSNGIPYAFGEECRRTG